MHFIRPCFFQIFHQINCIGFLIDIDSCHRSLHKLHYTIIIIQALASSICVQPCLTDITLNVYYYQYLIREIISWYYRWYFIDPVDDVQCSLIRVTDRRWSTMLFYQRATDLKWCMIVTWNVHLIWYMITSFTADTWA